MHASPAESRPGSDALVREARTYRRDSQIVNAFGSRMQAFSFRPGLFVNRLVHGGGHNVDGSHTVEFDELALLFVVGKQRSGLGVVLVQANPEAFRIVI